MDLTPLCPCLSPHLFLTPNPFIFSRAYLIRIFPLQVSQPELSLSPASYKTYCMYFSIVTKPCNETDIHTPSSNVDVSNQQLHTQISLKTKYKFVSRSCKEKLSSIFDEAKRKVCSIRLNFISIQIVDWASVTINVHLICTYIPTICIFLIEILMSWMNLQL